MAKRKVKARSAKKTSWWSHLAGNELLLVGLAALLAVVGLVLMFLEVM